MSVWGKFGFGLDMGEKSVSVDLQKKMTHQKKLDDKMVASYTNYVHCGVDAHFKTGAVCACLLYGIFSRASTNELLFSLVFILVTILLVFQCAHCTKVVHTSNDRIHLFDLL